MTAKEASSKHYWLVLDAATGKYALQLCIDSTIVTSKEVEDVLERVRITGSPYDPEVQAEKLAAEAALEAAKAEKAA